MIYNKTPYYIYEPLENVRKEYIESKKVIEVADYGAGSHTGLATSRRISQIAKYSLKSKKYAQLLFRLAEEKKCQRILELGTSLGLTTLYLSYACPRAQITTIEGSGSIAKIAAKSFERAKKNKIMLLEGKFDDVLPGIFKEQKPFDFVFIDGHHEEKACLSYFSRLLDTSINKDTLMVVDDIHWSPGMKRAWRTIMKNEKVTLSIDLFELGLVYFFPRNQKEHFTIRY